MSRFAKFAQSLASGYALIGVNVLYTLAMLPLAVAYLGAVEFGLWAGITAIATQIQVLADFGMTGSVFRILADHKDDRVSDQYGRVIQTGFLALAAQGLLVALLGGALSYWTPQLLNVPVEYHAISRLLMAGQCLLLAAGFLGRIFTLVLQAHHRFDAGNYSQMAGLLSGLAALWAALEAGLGLYSMLVCSAAGTVITNLGYVLACRRLRLLPEPGRWGRPDWATFRRIFAFATDIFMVSLGQALVAASQAPVIAHVLDLRAVAVWTTLIKTFMLAQQLIHRIFDFSASAFAEMMVRGERERLHQRFRDVTVLTASAAVVVCVAVALCNHAFVQVWMGGRFSWPRWNDALMALYIVAVATTRVHLILAVLTKVIGRLRLVYPLEGLLFLGLSLLLSAQLDLAGVIQAGIAANVIATGGYGLWRTTRYFGIHYRDILLGWLKPSIALLGLMALAATVIGLATQPLAPKLALPVNAALIGAVGTVAFWRLGLPDPLRRELRDRLAGWRTRLAGVLKFNTRSG
ncbi:MAG: oligosaccharide flippase family protein [Verrucomicrobiae bacterium]|nr:oligosaccharide flippase family protein [Verrucomicrobiae bacterium]MDW8309801.1 oligosaccharide flippase family protein [Verrucomicrobiales bacterium]